MPHRCYTWFFQQQNSFLPWVVSWWGQRGREPPAGPCRGLNFLQELLHPLEWGSTGPSPCSGFLTGNLLITLCLNPSPTSLDREGQLGMGKDSKILFRSLIWPKKKVFQFSLLSHPSWLQASYLKTEMGQGSWNTSQELTWEIQREKGQSFSSTTTKKLQSLRLGFRRSD